VVSDEQANGSGVSLDRETKSKIKRWVLSLRGAFEKDFAQQLRRLGIDADIEPNGPPAYLSEDEKQQRKRILALIRREQQAEGTRAKAIEAYVRDCTFTIINRLVGLRCMEARGLLFVDGKPAEAITIHGPTIHGGRPSLLAQMREESREYRNPTDGEERLWRDALKRACEAVSEDIHVLFDPDHEFSILSPAHATLMEAVRAIHEDLPPEVYRAPDFLGWVYQFFNAEEKVAIREATKGKPRNSHELAVINQFYTPDWIVKFLVDNTLGRVWLQMHPDTRLYWKNRVESADDGSAPARTAPHPPAPATAERGGDGNGGETAGPDGRADGARPCGPSDGLGDDGKTAGVRHHAPGGEEEPPDPFTPAQKAAVMFHGVNIDYLVPDTGEGEAIAAKPVSEITLLDPACGTMHFGQYACAIFYEMYLEEGVVAPAEIPNAILQNNLFGVDIDPRAIQIAALALLLTVKELARDHGLPPESLRVRGMNLVCANSVNLGEEEREKLLKRLDPNMFGGDVPMKRAVEALWENLEHVGELGSLIQVDDSVERALGQVSTWRMKFVGERQMTLGDEPEWGALQATLTAEERTTAREYLLDELHALAAGKGNGDVMAQLFAQETEKGLRLLEVLGRKYDAVVMNPPFGSYPQGAAAAARSVYPESRRDISGAFLSRASGLSGAGGLVGVLMPHTVVKLSSFRRIREQVLLASLPLALILDLGFGVLDDAMVETIAVVCGAGQRRGQATALRLSGADAAPGAVFQRWLAVTPVEREQLRHDVPLDRFGALPGSPLAYACPESQRTLYSRLPRFADGLGEIRVGLQTFDDERFVRMWWEVDRRSLGRGQRWLPFAKGGDYARYYADVDLVVDWGEAAHDVYSRRTSQFCIFLTPKSQDRYLYRHCLSYPEISFEFGVRYVPAGGLLGHVGPAVYLHDDSSLWRTLGVLNSNAFFRLLQWVAETRRWRAGYVESVPVPAAWGERGADLDASARRVHRLKKEWDCGSEASTQFVVPWALQADAEDSTTAACPIPPSLPDRLVCLLQREDSRSAECQSLQDEIDEIVYGLYEITPEDRELIERDLGDRPAETVWPQMAGKSTEEKRLEHVLRLLSYLAKTVCEEDDDGVVPLVPCGEEPTILERARHKLDELFGADRGHEIEAEINNELRVRIKGNKNCGPKMDMDTWLSTRYFDYHVGLYKHRPIFWHIQSDDGSFGVLCHYHRFNRNRLQKLRAHYLATFMDRLRREIGELQGDDSKDARARQEKLEGNLRAAEELNRKLGLILTGEPDPKTGEQYRIQVPWKSDDEQPKGWEPDIDDGVKVNIGPLQEAGVLAVRRVV